jgi:hypothetical protein
MEESGEWSTFCRGRRNPPFSQTEISPFPHILISPFPPYTTYQNICQIHNMGKIVSIFDIDLCPKWWKMITKSYNSYGKYLKMFENFQGFFEKSS